MPTFELRSTDGETLSVARTSALFSGPGQDRSPNLAWNDCPAETLSFAVTCYDPDALTVSDFWHWAVCEIPSSVNELPAGAGDTDGKSMPAEAKMPANDAGRHGFLGADPRSEEAPHRYMFIVHALDAPHARHHYGGDPRWLGFRLVTQALARATLTPVFRIPA